MRKESREDRAQLMIPAGPGHLLSGTACNFPQGPLAANHHHCFLSPLGCRQQLCPGTKFKGSIKIIIFFFRTTSFLTSRSPLY